MNGRALVIWSAGALVVALASNNPVYRALLVAISLDLLLVRMPPGRSVGPLLRAAGVLGGSAIILNVLLSHSGGTVLLQLPDAWPLVGGAITLESTAYGAAAGLGLIAAVLAVAPLSLVLETHDLIDSLPRGLERSGLAVAAALNLVPGIGRNATAVRDAERLRGWRPRGPRSWAEILVPTMLSAIEDAIALAEAMEARAYGTGLRSRYAPVPWRPLDVAVAAAALAAASLFLGARLLGWPLDWQPYPNLTLPPLEPLLAVGVLLLALPAVPWPSRTSNG